MPNASITMHQTDIQSLLTQQQLLLDVIHGMDAACLQSNIHAQNAWLEEMTLTIQNHLQP